MSDMPDHPSSQAQAKVALPPLPEAHNEVEPMDIHYDVFTASQMCDYATAAIAQDRAARALSGDSTMVPSGLSREELRAFITARAQGAGEAVALRDALLAVQMDAVRLNREEFCISEATYLKVEKSLGLYSLTQPASIRLTNAPSTVTDDRVAFKNYLAECEGYAIVPDVAGAFNAGWTARGATPPVQGDQPTPAGYVLVPREPTEAMIAAYLVANDAYWRETDQIPTRPGKWRNGTPSEATRVSLLAALAAAPQVAHPQPLAASEAEPEPFGQVAVYPSKHPNQVTRYEFYPWPQSPYLDNASECVVVYRKEPQ